MDRFFPTKDQTEAGDGDTSSPRKEFGPVKDLNIRIAGKALPGTETSDSSCPGT
jgi:hypothetical protein